MNNWIDWNGGECPVERGTLVDVKYRDLPSQIGVSALTWPSDDDHIDGEGAGNFAVDWFHDDEAGDIIAYRLSEEWE